MFVRRPLLANKKRVISGNCYVLSGAEFLERYRQYTTQNSQDFLQAFNTSTRKDSSINTKLVGFRGKNL